MKSSDITRLAPLLKDKSMVLIGGDCRPDRKAALEKALGISELVWIKTKPGRSVKTFAPYVARPEVAVVVLAIRWASHSFGEVRKFCDLYDKPLVRLPGGYNPNQIANQILGQCGKRLESSA